MTVAVGPLLTSISLEGFLSYGPETVTCPLTALNVLIGPNGSGKSNLIEALSVLRAVPRDLPLPIRQGGGVKDWLWRDGKAAATQARLEIEVGAGHVALSRPRAAVRYRLVFDHAAQLKRIAYQLQVHMGNLQAALRHGLYQTTRLQAWNHFAHGAQRHVEQRHEFTLRNELPAADAASEDLLREALVGACALAHVVGLGSDYGKYR